MLASPVRHRRGIRRVVGGLGLTLALLVPATAAHAEWYLSRNDAQAMARDYVSKHYADTYASDLTTYCRPQGRSYDPRYRYHRWTCGWYDRDDATKGAVSITGSSGSGYYFGRVLIGAH
jgi:hypothetical protein